MSEPTSFVRSYCVVSQHTDDVLPRVVGPFASEKDARAWFHGRRSADRGWTHCAVALQKPVGNS